MHMSEGIEVVVSPKSRGIVVGYCRKYTVGRRRASLSSRISSLVLRGSRRSSCSVPVGGVVVADVWLSIYGAAAFGGPCGLGSCMHQRQWGAWRPEAPGRSAGVHTMRSGGRAEVPDSTRGRSGAPPVRAECPSRKDT